MKIVKKTVFTIGTILLILVLTYNIYNFISLKILKSDIATVGGYGILEVVSGSMEPVIHVGDMIIIDTDNYEYGLDDIVTFYDSEGTFTTHRIIDVDENGLFTTKGDNNNTKDKNKIESEKIIGCYVGRIPKAGRILSSFKSPVTLILILVIGVLVCILLSTDKDGNPILDEKEKEYEEFLAYQSAKAKNELEVKTSSTPRKNASNTKKKNTASSNTTKNKKSTTKVKNEEPKKKTSKNTVTNPTAKKKASSPKKAVEKKANTKAKVTVKTVEEKPKTKEKVTVKTVSEKTKSTVTKKASSNKQDAKNKTTTKKNTNTKPKVTVKTVTEKPKNAKTSTTKKVVTPKKETAKKSSTQTKKAPTKKK